MTTNRTSLLPAVRGRIFDTLAAGLAVETFYGWDPTIAFRDAVVVGGLAPGDNVQTFQNFGGPGRPAMEENFHLIVMVRTTVAEAGNRAAYERTYATVAEVERLLRDPAAAADIDGVQLFTIDRLIEAGEAWDTEGWQYGVDIYVRIQALI